jgi:hypothetical protein
MASRGRRLAVALILLALLLSAGRWASAFLADRLWEAAVSERVAQAGARRAVLALGLELSVLVLAVVWFTTQFVIAARIALPDRPPPERNAAKTWPSQLPRWSLVVLAVVMGGLLGSGAGAWLDELLLTLGGLRFGVLDPLLGADLGVFLQRFPLWLDLQHKALLLIASGLGGVLLIHIAGETVRVTKRRLWLWPQARAQLGVLLALLALVLGWSCMLEPYRLAAGLRGPLLPSEFLLRSLIWRIQAGLAAGAALVSLLWWFRLRASAVIALWSLFGLSLVVGRGLPLHGDTATEDPSWQIAGRALDSVAFQLSGLESPPRWSQVPAGSLRPSLWDDTVLAQAAGDSSQKLSEPRRGWIPVAGNEQPVWFAVREPRGQGASLLALSDDRVAASGGLMAWHQADSLPTPEVGSVRALAPSVIRPLAPRLRVSSEGPGVALGSWARRIMLAWALQAPDAFRGTGESRIVWRLDPAERLAAVAPFVHWTAPRARIVGSALYWQSDGLLSSSLFPSSSRVDWGSGRASMLRSTFLGLVDAASGEVRVFQRDAADSLAAAWARITRPLIEPAAAVPSSLREHEAYSDELLLAQAKVLEGKAWKAGRLERLPGGTGILPPAEPGGSEYLVPFLRNASPGVGALLLAWRTSAGDSLRLIRLDSLWTVDGSNQLSSRWEMFPFQQAIHDSVQAVGGNFVRGQVRFALAAEGVMAAQPAWSVNAGGRAQLVLLNVALGRRSGADRMELGAGRNLVEAWKNFRHEPTPIAAGSSAQAILDRARILMLHLDSAQKRGDLQELGRTIAELRDLLRRP